MPEYLMASKRLDLMPGALVVEIIGKVMPAGNHPEPLDILMGQCQRTCPAGWNKTVVVQLAEKVGLRPSPDFVHGGRLAGILLTEHDVRDAGIAHLLPEVVHSPVRRGIIPDRQREFLRRVGENRCERQLRVFQPLIGNEHQIDGHGMNALVPHRHKAGRSLSVRLSVRI